MYSYSQIKRGQFLSTLKDYIKKGVSAEKDWREQITENNCQLCSKRKIPKTLKTVQVFFVKSHEQTWCVMLTKQ